MRRLLCALLLLVAPLATAGPLVALDGGYAVPIDGEPVLEGAGINGRLGWSLDLQVLEIVPEVGLAWYGRLVPEAGGRLIFGQRMRPGVYAHAVLPLDLDRRPTLGADAGLSLDFGAPRTVGFGLYLGGITRDVNAPGAGISFVGGGALTLRL
jgi:hypothetical protein